MNNLELPILNIIVHSIGVRLTYMFNKRIKKIERKNIYMVLE